MDDAEGFHPAGVIAVDDPIHIVRVAYPNEFLRFVDEASKHRLSGMWRTRDAFAKQVAPESRMLVVPILRNGGPVSLPKSVRCQLWFVDRASGLGSVTLVDLLESWLSELNQLRTPEEFTRAVRFVLDTSPMTVLRQSE